jgi:hypothetical protein
VNVDRHLNHIKPALSAPRLEIEVMNISMLFCQEKGRESCWVGGGWRWRWG